jgi:hypothetical protein
MNPHSVVSLDRQLVSVQVGRERITEVLHGRYVFYRTYRTYRTYLRWTLDL